MDFLKALLAYYEEAATRYEAIEPAFGPLAARLVHAAQLRPGERVIDLGTGSGLAARLAMQKGCWVCGLDFSPQMLHTARRKGLYILVQGDMHCLPFQAGTFDVALAAFAFNSTDPTLSLREACRVLKRGGRLVLAEWGHTDLLSSLLYDTLAEYQVEEPSPDLAARRAERQRPHPWDALEDLDDLKDALQQAGFARTRVWATTATVRFNNVGDFIRYKLAWPSRHAELEAMSPEVRALCLSDLHENLGQYADRFGRLIWQPEIVLARAVKAAH